MVRNRFAVSALLCGSVMLGACGMWSDRDGGRSSQGSARGSTNSAQSAGSSSQSTGSASRTQVSQVQQALKAKGYDPGTTDGVMGASTQEALRKFQQANGLPVTGMVDGQTAKALGISGSSGTTSSSEGRGSTGSGASSSRDSGGSSSGTSSGSSSSGSGSSGSSRSGGSSGSGN